VGRDVELADLSSYLLGAVQGVGDCVLIEGPPGIGKSRLLATLAERAQELGMAATIARTNELDRVAPLNTFLTALQDSEPPVLTPADIADIAAQSGSNRFLLVDRIGERLEEYAHARPLLLALDDAQWADELTLLLVRILVPRLSTSAVLWLFACRPLPSHAPDALQGLIDEGAHRVQLAPLSADAVRQMCENLLRATPDETVLGLVQRGGGNPFLVEELLTRLKDGGQVRIDGMVATSTTWDLPPDFVTAVDRRLSDLSLDSRRLLDAGAVFSRPFTVHEAAGLIGKAPADLAGTAKEVVDLGILVSKGAELGFRHELLREAVYYRLPLPIRQAMHREAAVVLRSEGRPMVEVATHLAQSARRGDQAAVEVLREAAGDVAAKAPGTAADLVVRTLELVDEQDAIRPALIAEAVRFLALAGRIDEAIHLGETALAEPMSEFDGSAILLGLAEALKHAGKHDVVVDYTTRALARTDLDETSRADLYAIRAHAMLHTGDLDGAEKAGQQAAEVGGAAGASAAVVSGHEARSVVLRSQGRLTEAVTVVRQAVRIAAAEGGEARHRHPGLWLGRALVAVDQFVEAESIYHSGRRLAEELGSAWSLPLWHLYLADMQRDAGRLDDANAEAEAGLRVADQLSARATSPSLLAVLANVAVCKDDLALAERELTRAEHFSIGDIGLAAQDIAWSRALVAEARGDNKAAMEALGGQFEALPRRLLLLAQSPPCAPHMVRIAAAAGDRAAAAAVAAAAAELAKRNPNVASLAGAAAQATGLATHSVRELREAVQAFRFSPRVLGSASAMEDAARAEHSMGHHSRAVELLDEALHVFVRCDAVRDAARVRRRLRRLGVRRRSGRDSTSTASGWGSLTDSELRVVRLVAEGMTNRTVAQRLFLSPHTVDSHLRHSFAKLGVSSRVELTRHVLTHDSGNREDA
jgi:DNA-binding CsgD family transcriptional regulator